MSRVFFIRLCLLVLFFLGGKAGTFAQNQYRILGEEAWLSEEAWNARAQGLPEGDFTLEVRQENSNGAIQQLHFSIEKPWWGSGLFLISVAGLLALAVYGLLHFRVRAVRKAGDYKNTVMQLERSALQAQMNPHFIFNSLNSIQAYIANNETDRANRFLAKFARLIRSMLNNSRDERISLQREIEALQLYLELEKMRFKEKFDFKIEVDQDLETDEIMLPPLLIQPYLENAIIHGLAQTRSKGHINLYYILDGKYLCVTVTDNGIGIEQSKALKHNKKGLHKSVGMSITQKRLELLDAGNTDKKVEIKEIKGNNGEVLGTKVEVKIRVDNY